MAATSGRPESSQQTLAAIDKIFAQIAASFTRAPGVTLGRGWASGNYVLKLNDKIFAMLDPRKNGRVMKEWFVANTASAEWSGLAREAHRFVKAGK